ncbi:MAG: hypothetical protein QOH83_57 [Solirubrobacteraceae bacterium]|nr:hypothetical protein [Solirubrobacteraceae bacterium]
MKGDRVEIVVATDDGSRTYEIIATRAGRRVDHNGTRNRRGRRSDAHRRACTHRQTHGHLDVNVRQTIGQRDFRQGNPDRGAAGASRRERSTPIRRYSSSCKAVHAARLDVEEIAVGGLEGVADVAQRRSVGQDELPVGAGAGKQRPVELRPCERPARLGHDAPVPARHVAGVQRLAEAGLQAVDEAQARRRESAGARTGLVHHGSGRIVGVRVERRHGDVHPPEERQRAEQTVELVSASRAVEADDLVVGRPGHARARRERSQLKLAHARTRHHPPTMSTAPCRRPSHRSSPSSSH